MSKEKSPTKDKNKKEPEKNLKEKRAEKKAKRDNKRQIKIENPGAEKRSMRNSEKNRFEIQDD